MGEGTSNVDRALGTQALGQVNTRLSALLSLPPSLPPIEERKEEVEFNVPLQKRQRRPSLSTCPTGYCPRTPKGKAAFAGVLVASRRRTIKVPNTEPALAGSLLLLRLLFLAWKSFSTFTSRETCLSVIKFGKE